MECEDDDDTHICLRCKTTIVGLEQYIKHRKERCSITTTKSNTNEVQKATNQLDINLSVLNEKIHHEESPNFIGSSLQAQARMCSQSCLEKEQYSSHETNVSSVNNLSVSNPIEQPNEFFSSLELQSKNGSITQRIASEEQIDFSNFDASDKDCTSGRQFVLGKSVNFDMDFELSPESNDHGFPSDESEDEIHPSSRHSGGKWKPGYRPPSGYTGGKWKPSSSPPPQPRNINKENLNETLESVSQNEKLITNDKNNEDEEEDNNNNNNNNNENYNCELCNKKLSSKYTYERHCSSSFHKKRLSQSNNINRHSERPSKSSNESASEIYFCDPCKKRFKSKKHMVRHLLTPLHDKCSKNHPDKLKLIFEFQNIMAKHCPFQCSICAFYFNNPKELLMHLESNDHKAKIRCLIGPLYCNLCQYECLKNEDMLKHLNSTKHKQEYTQIDRPCIIKEKRYLINCKVCNLNHHSAAQLKKHMELKHPNTDLSTITAIPFIIQPKTNVSKQCSFCGLNFISSYNLTLHIRRRHTLERPYSCEPCKRTFVDKSTLLCHESSKFHQKNVNNNSHHKTKENDVPKMKHCTCRYCKDVFTNVLQFRQHVFEKHKVNVCWCDICGKSFISEIELRNHLQKKDHKLGNCSYLGDKYSCDMCDYICNSKSKLLYHQALHQTPVLEPISNTNKITATDTSNGNPEDELNCNDVIRKKFICKVACPVCNKMYAKSSLQLHIYTHTGEKPFKCLICDACFNQQATLSTHIKRHFGEKHHECSKCNYKCLKKSTLKRHQLTHVDRPRLFLCDICGAEHFDQWLLKNHMKLHNAKQYKCTYEGCKLAFKAKSEVTYHMRVHTNERPYLCDQCGYAGKSQHALTKHKRTHTGERPFKCQYCSYAATLTSHLKRHLRLHTGAKPFKCPYCAYSCNTHENVRKHILSTKKHSGQKVYPCKFCNYSTNESKEFREHLEKEHDNILESQDNYILSVIAGVYDKSHDPKMPLVPIPYTPKRNRLKDGQKYKKTKTHKKNNTLKLNTLKENDILRLDQVVTETLDLPTNSIQVVNDNNEDLLNSSTVFVNDITTGEVVMTNEEIFSEVAVSHQEETVNITNEQVEIVNEEVVSDTPNHSRTLIMYIKLFNPT